MARNSKTNTAKRNRFIHRSNPPKLYTPNGYSHVVVATEGRTIYIAGQVPNDKDDNIVGSGDFHAQAVQVYENLKAALANAGATFKDVVKLNSYLLDMTNAPILREVRKGYLGSDLPASTLVQVGKLARDEFMLEIEAIAVTAK